MTLNLNTKTAWLILSLTLVSASLQAQQKPISPRPERSLANAKRVPVYRSKSDSIQLETVNRLFQQAIAANRESRKYSKDLDSLSRLVQKIQMEGVLRYKDIYFSSPGFVTVDSLKKLSDFSRVTKISIENTAQVPQEVFRCINLESLEFVNTRINSLPDLNSLPNLRTVGIYNNRPTERFKLSRNQHITFLRIRNEDPTLLPKSYKNLTALQRLDLDDNMITKFPNGARKNKYLSEINLQYNRITLSSKIKKHRYLTNLTLKGNAIQKVPASISKLKNIRKLSFNTNQIAQVSNKIGKLKTLENLSFYKNKLTKIPDGAYKLSNLKEIDLFFNQIEKIELEKCEWNKMTSLFISSNKISSIPEGITKLKSLEGIYAWDNMIQTLPESLGTMTGIKYIRINGNYLKTLPSSIVNLTKLEELDISSNYITQLPEAIFNFEKLKIIAFTNNPLDEPTRNFIVAKGGELKAREVFVHE